MSISQSYTVECVLDLSVDGVSRSLTIRQFFYRRLAWKKCLLVLRIQAIWSESNTIWMYNSFYIAELEQHCIHMNYFTWFKVICSLLLISILRLESMKNFLKRTTVVVFYILYDFHLYAVKGEHEGLFIKIFVCTYRDCPRLKMSLCLIHTQST